MILHFYNACFVMISCDCNTTFSIHLLICLYHLDGFLLVLMLCTYKEHFSCIGLFSFAFWLYISDIYMYMIYMHVWYIWYIYIYMCIYIYIYIIYDLFWTIKFNYFTPKVTLRKIKKCAHTFQHNQKKILSVSVKIQKSLSTREAIYWKKS